MKPAWRGVQDRLPLDQLPFLVVGPGVREGVEFLHGHWAGVDDGDAYHEGALKSSALHENRPAALRPFAFAQDAETLGDLRIGLEQSAEIAAEAVLVELLAGLDVPQPTRVGRYLVRHHDPHHVVFPQPAALHLEIDEANADTEKQAGEEIIDPHGECHDVVNLLRRCPAESRDVLLRHHRIAERVVLVIEFDDGARQLRSLLDAEPLRQRARGDVAHDDFKRNDLHLPNELLAHIQPADEMRRHADIIEVLEHVFGDAIVQHALAFDHLMLLRIEGSGIILEVLNQRSRLWSDRKSTRLNSSHQIISYAVFCLKKKQKSTNMILCMIISLMVTHD